MRERFSMTRPRKLKLAAFMRQASIHTGAWRYPGAFPDANFNFAHLKRFAQTLERGKFAAFFMADHMAVLNMPLDALKRSHTVTSFEPFTLLSALSQVTERIGLVATGSPTFDAPYHIPRRFSSLAHISRGPAGWNIVHTFNSGADVKGRMEKLGRSRAHMKILPACFVVLGDTVEEARAKRAKLDSLVDYANAIASLSISLGHDASKFDPDRPLPDHIPESNASKSGRQRAIDLARRENLTVRQLAQRLGGYSGLAMVGTSKTIADEMEEWLFTEGSDGFTVMFPYLPGGLDDFVAHVIPELQHRGLFRRDYEGTTLREHLGLPRPHNRFFP